MQKNQVDIFNFLRAFALFCVLGIHSRIVISQNVPSFSSAESWHWYSLTPAWVAMGMFFMLSGYLLGKGFYNNKYKTDCNGIINFYLTRLIRILPMYLFFTIAVLIFIYPEALFIHKWKLILPLLTFTYSGNPAVEGIGATWFVSTIFQLYLIAPLFYKFIVSKINCKYHIFIFLALLMYSLVYRVIGLQIFNLPWFANIYIPSWVNVDYFLCGILLNSLTQNSTDNDVKKWIRPISLIGLFAFLMHLMQLHYHNHYTFYLNYAPTVIILIYSVIIWSFDSKDRVKSCKLSFTNILKNPLRIFDCIGILSFGLYLYHSNFFAIMPKLLMNAAVFPSYHSNGRILTYTYIYTFAILIIWSTILYFYIEKPSNKYRTTINFDMKLALANAKRKILRIFGGGVNPLVACVTAFNV